MTKLISSLIAVSATLALGTGNVAMAKSHKTPMECTKDGKTVKAHSKKACTKMGGTWEAKGSTMKGDEATTTAPTTGTEQAPSTQSATGTEQAPAAQGTTGAEQAPSDTTTAPATGSEQAPAGQPAPAQ